jgi:ATP-binding cassette subfamily B protein
MMNSIDLIKPYFAENRWIIALGLFSLIVVDVLQLFIPRVIKLAVDDLTLYSIDSAGLLRYAGLIFLIGLFIGLFRYIWRHCLLGTARKAEEALRNQLFCHLQTLSAEYFDRVKTGDLMAHATNDIQQVRMAAGMGMVAFNDALVLGTAAIGFMVYIQLELTLLVLIPMPFIVVGARYFGRRMHRRYQGVQASFSDLTEAVRERFAGIRVVKAYNTEALESRRISQVSRGYIRKNMKLIKITGVFYPMMILFTNISLALVLYLGGRRTISADITPGDFVAFLNYLGLLTWPMMALGWVTNLIQRGRASLDRLNTILKTCPEVMDSPRAQPLAGLRSGIRFENVSFAYAADRARVLSGIRLDLAAGQTLGIIGPPGSGKSTILQLLPRLYDVAEGQILVDGMDLRRLKLADLRSLIAYVPQEPFLFAGTIGDNITFGDPNVNRARLNQAVKMAAIDETIRQLPHGLDTLVGEKGVILSGGQKQRIALARAFLKDAPLLLLDDPISQVDAQTANRIIASIRCLTGQRTILMVSHRLSAVCMADQIVSLESGIIVESGTHPQLMENGGYYARTFRLQEIEDAV